MQVAYDRYEQAMKNGGSADPVFSLTIGGHDFTFSAYNAHKLCVRTLEKASRAAPSTYGII